MHYDCDYEYDCDRTIRYKFGALSQKLTTFKTDENEKLIHCQIMV